MSIKIASRGKGKSAVAAAAYRSGEKITNEYDGVIHDYTRKGGVTHTEILLPENAPPEYADRATLWNAVEKIEKNKNSQLAREIEIALPVELSAGQNLSLVREYCKQNFVAAGMCADICIHDKGDGNPHAHIMLTMRPFEQDGSWAAKSRKEYILGDNGERIRLKSGAFKTRKVDTVDWNDQTKAEEWRAAWAETANRYLVMHSETHIKIDHRSYERQGIDKIPTIHLGVAASQMEKRGIRTERGNINREIEISNQKLRQLKARIGKLQTWLKEERENTEPPTLANVIENILMKRQQSRKATIENLKAAARCLNFLTAHNIKDMAGLSEYVAEMYGKQIDLRDELKPIERRLKTLDEHIKYADNYMKYRETNRQYRQQKPKHQADFYETHRHDMILFEAAERYLKGVMNGKTGLPIKAWKTERDKLNADKRRLNGEYVALKNDTAEVEEIRRNVYDIMNGETRREQPKKAHDMEL